MQQALVPLQAPCCIGIDPTVTINTASTAMSTSVPTITDLLESTDIGNCLHRWRTEGGAITIDRATLRQALEEAYDPEMPNWPAMVEIDNA